MNYIVNFIEKNKDIKKEEYVENLLKYSKEKKSLMQNLYIMFYLILKKRKYETISK